MSDVDLNQGVSDLNALAGMVSGDEPYKRLRQLTRAAAAFANVYGDRKALIVMEVDMDQEIGRLAKEAADRISSLVDDNQKLRDDNKQLTDDADTLQEELTTAEGQLQAALDKAAAAAGGGSGTDTTLPGGGGPDTTVPGGTVDPAVGLRKGPAPIKPIASVPARAAVVQQHK